MASENVRISQTPPPFPQNAPPTVVSAHSRSAVYRFKVPQEFKAHIHTDATSPERVTNTKTLLQIKCAFFDFLSLNDLKTILLQHASKSS